MRCWGSLGVGWREGCLKISLYAGHDEGGRNRGRIGSLIGTCKMNGVESYAYLCGLCTNIAKGQLAMTPAIALGARFQPARLALQDVACLSQTGISARHTGNHR